MRKKRFVVIGHPILHSMSPFIHDRLFALSGSDAEYSVLDVDSQELPRRIKQLQELDGFNITIPHKTAIIPYLDKLDKKAALYGSVNTVKRDGDALTGYTTDPDGFLMALKAAKIPLKGRVVVLGAGGVSRTIAFEAALAGCQTVIAVRPSGLLKAAQLAGEIFSNVTAAQIETCLIDRLSGNFSLLVNGTPVGMYPSVGAMPVSTALLSRCGAVYDAVYNPDETELVKAARANGSAACGGMSMLVWQAAAAHKIWENAEYRAEDIEELCRDAVMEMNRIFKGV